MSQIDYSNFLEAIVNGHFEKSELTTGNASVSTQVTMANKGLSDEVSEMEKINEHVDHENEPITVETSTQTAVLSEEPAESNVRRQTKCNNYARIKTDLEELSVSIFRGQNSW